MTILADHLRNHLAEQIDAGTLPIQSDTRAFSIGLSVQTPQGDDSDIRTRRAGQSYIQGGRWTEPVRKHVTPIAYTQEHFNERVAPVEVLTGSGVRARVFTRLGWGFWWYFGHHNVFTRRDEGPRDWIYAPALDWSKQNAAGYFKNLL